MKKSILIIMATVCCTVVVAQPKTRKADRLFERWEYYRAAKLYEKAADKNPTQDINYKLGLTYHKMLKYKEAEEAYARVAAAGPYHNPEFYYNYGQILKNNEKYELAMEQFRKYSEMNPTDLRGEYYLQSCEIVMEDHKYDLPLLVSDVASVNTKEACFAPVFYKDGIVFASDRDASTGTKTYGWHGGGYLDLFYAERNNSDTLFKPVDKFNKVNHIYHDGPATFTSDGNTMYYNRVSKELKGRDRSRLKIERNKIYVASLNENGEWDDIEAFPYNSDLYSVATPCITRDGNRIYFSSDMPGGLGESDIYYCNRVGDGWGAPINMGIEINTKGKEKFPTLDSAGNLYFVSDGYQGFGGLDVCVSKNDGGYFHRAEVLKAPLNSSYDEYGIQFIDYGKTGYISSDRMGGAGDADIFYFDMGDEVLAFDYVIGWRPFVPVPEEPEVIMGVKEKVFTARIHFDFDKSNIRPDAAIVLDSVVDYLKANPELNVEIGAHCDCRGSDAYNIGLSNRRANSTLNYLSSKGINTFRMKGQGFGERVLVNGCRDGVKCTEAEHQLNRRVEFKFILDEMGEDE